MPPPTTLTMIGGLSYGSASWWCLSELYFTCFRKYRGCNSHRHNMLKYFRQPREIRFWIFTARRLMILTYQITRRISERHNLQPPSNAFSLTIRFSITETNDNSRDILQLCIYLIYIYIYIHTHIYIYIYIKHTYTKHTLTFSAYDPKVSLYLLSILNL